MARIVNICDVCSEIFAGGDAPKGNMSETKTEEYNIPIYANGEANEGLYGYTNKARVTKPSITVSARGTIGYTAIRPTPFVPIVRLITLTPNPELIDIKYLYYAAQNYKFDGSGTSIPQLTVPSLKKYSFPLPAMEEQAHIVMILDNVCDLIDQKKQQLELLDELVKSRFIELFGDPVLNPKKWTVCELSEHIQFLTSGSRGWSQYFTESGEYFITIKNVKNCRITLDDVQYVVPPDNAEAKRTRVQEGDLLISITADLGRTGVVTKEIAEYGGYINQHLTCIRLNQETVRPLYVAYYMESEAGKSQFQSKNQSAVKAGLNFNSINSLRLMVPSVELQDAFIAFVEQTDKSKLAVQQSIAELEELKKSLMQIYFG